MNPKSRKLTKALLWAPGKIYELLVRLRIAAYETEYLRPKHLDAAVISVGNITVGGTGKTPLVAYLARYLSDEGYRVGILTRGYGRKSRGIRVLNEPGELGARELNEHGRGAHLVYGDEPVMIARKLSGIPIVVNADRYEAGVFAQERLGCQVLIMDDGYQHQALARDLNIVLLDATDPFGGFEMVPFGRLREPLYALKRADAVIITRAHRAFDQGETLSIIKYFCGDQTPVMYAHSSIVQLRHLQTGELYDSDDFNGWNAVAMCGVGNPGAFAEDVVQVGVKVIEEHVFGDHFIYGQPHLDKVRESARGCAADMIITTEKDAVRLEGLDLGDIPVYSAVSEVQSEDEIRLKSLILRTVLGKH